LQNKWQTINRGAATLDRAIREQDARRASVYPPKYSNRWL